MKLIPAGFGEMATPYTDLLFNCTRNQKCQRTFYVPVKLFSDIVLFTDLPGEPTLVQIDVLNVCDIENEGSAVASKYVAGTKPDGSWYAVLGSLIVTPPIGVVYHKFFFRVTFTVSGIDYIYFSEQYEFPICETLTFVRGCYPNQEVGTDAFDCNGIYYGFPNNEEDFLGDHNYRYVHSGYVRLGSVIEQRNKMTFTAFNNRTTYKSVFNREWLFEQDIVPTFYKDVLIGIYNRGMVQVDGKEWKLADSQDVAMIDTDSKLWRLDIVFDEECKQSYGCKPRDCFLPVDPCCVPTLISADAVICETPTVASGLPLANAQVGVFYDQTITFTGPVPIAFSDGGIPFVDKPAWMTLIIVGNTVHLTGTPDVTGTDVPVQFNVFNCSGDFVAIDEEINVTEVGEDNFNINCVGSVDVTVTEVETEDDWYEVSSGTFPVTPGNQIVGHQTGVADPPGRIIVHVTTPGDFTRYMKLVKNGIVVNCQFFVFSGTYQIPWNYPTTTLDWVEADVIEIRIDTVPC